MKISKPGKGSGIKLDNLIGSLLLIEPLRVETDIKTDYGLADAIAANVHVVDGDEAGALYRDALLFQKKLQGQIRHAVGAGEFVAGRLEKGPKLKPGQSEPWQLAEPTDADERLAAKYVDGLPIGTGVLGGDDQPPF